MEVILQAIKAFVRLIEDKLGFLKSDIDKVNQKANATQVSANRAQQTANDAIAMTEEARVTAEEAVSSVQTIAENVKYTVDTKMDKNNPVGTGSFSMNRKYGTVVGGYSFAEGFNTTASGDQSHAEGANTKASGYHSHAEGYKTTASGIASHAEGSSTVASNGSSHAEGNETTASGAYSHTEGSETTASEAYSHAEGSNTTASGVASHAEGSNTTASGMASHAEGSNTQASGAYSHTEGYDTIAYSQYQHVQGKYNIEDAEDKYAHIVGNGTFTTKRSNAHTLDWEGNAWYQGALRLGGTSYDDAKEVITLIDRKTVICREILFRAKRYQEVRMISDLPLELGCRYDVTIKGVTYRFTAYEWSPRGDGTDKTICIGLITSGQYDLPEGNPNVRFYICNYFEGNRRYLVFFSTIYDYENTNSEFIVEKIEGDVIKEEYIPDTIAKKREIPTTLPNPNALTFTGAVEGTYDGSTPLIVNIPSGGGTAMPSDMELLADLIDTDMLPAIHNSSNKILTDSLGNIILRY